MNINMSSFLANSLRILNIANKTIPLIKEANPTIKSIKKRYMKIKNNMNYTPYEKKAPKVIEQPKNIVYQNNSLTFFR